MIEKEKGIMTGKIRKVEEIEAHVYEKCSVHF